VQEKSIMRFGYALVFIAGIAAGLSLGGLFSGLFLEGVQPDLSVIPQLSLEGFSRVNVSAEPGLVHLISGCRRLSMVVGVQQSESIREGLSGELGFRPTSHDTVGDILKSFDIEALMVKVDGFQDGTYFAKLIVMKGNDILNLDSRPSDAIAIAVRSGAPVYVRDSIMEEHGRDVCQVVG
jgi:bifunctional DNase/RNase